LVITERAKTYPRLCINEMTENNSSGQRGNLNHKKSSQEPAHLLSPSAATNQIIVSSRHPHITDNSHRTSMRSTGGSGSSNSRARNGHSSIQMEPGLQSLLVAEGRAAEMIAAARVKRNELIRQSNHESQVEIEAFRLEREGQYRKKLHEATHLEQFQSKLDADRLALLEQMEKNVKKERKSLVKYIIHCVIDQILVEPHPNTKRVMF
jgi:ATP synthase subunit G